jgi:DNA mismatch endonuclease, patch repair protein
MANTERDKKNRARLRGLGWDVLVVWDCETANTSKLSRKIQKFLEK